MTRGGAIIYPESTRHDFQGWLGTVEGLGCESLRLLSAAAVDICAAPRAKAPRDRGRRQRRPTEGSGPVGLGLEEPAIQHVLIPLFMFSMSLVICDSLLVADLHETFFLLQDAVCRSSCVQKCDNSSIAIVPRHRDFLIPGFDKFL